MKFKFLTLASVIALLVVAAVPRQLTAQTHQPQTPKHHHYKLIDMGTLGGPQSRIDYLTPLNSFSTVAGSADTPILNPYYGNDNPTFFSDPYIEHAFQWKEGVVTDLGSLPGGGVSQPNWINARGHVAGNASNSIIDPLNGYPESRAVLYMSGKVLDLGILAGGQESAATSLNNSDQVVGFADNATPDPYSIIGWQTQTRAFLWTKSRGIQDLGTLGGPDALANTMNERGQVVGFSYVNSTPNPTTGIPTLDPFLWEDGKMIDLGNLGGTVSVGEGGPFVNNRGQVVDQSNLAGDIYFHPYLWTNPGPMLDLGTLGGNLGDATRINDAGEVVGWATNEGDQSVLAFLWKAGKMQSLGTVDGDPCSIAIDINEQHQIVGKTVDCVSNDLHAFLWEDGSMVDLNSVVQTSDGVQLFLADYINNRGEITAAGVLPNGDNRAYLLIPCDEKHPRVEGCDYTVVEASDVASRPSPSIGSAGNRELSSLLMRRISRNRFAGRAFGPKE